MTDEESYTCEYCKMKFETIGAWRRHDGRNSNSGEKLAGEESTALCQRKKVKLRTPKGESSCPDLSRREQNPGTSLSKDQKSSFFDQQRRVIE